MLRTFSRLAGLTAILVATALALPPRATAQISIRGGFSLTDFFGDDAGNTEAVRSLSYGLSAPLLTLGPVQIVAEGYFRRKGAGWNVLDALTSPGAPIALDSAGIAALLSDTEAGLGGQTLEFGLDYVEIPVLLRWNFPLWAQRFRPYLQGGPAFAWRIECGIEVRLTAVEGGGGPEAACEDLRRENIERTLHEYETGMVVGGGIAMSVLGGAGALVLDARLTRGLSRLSGSADGPEVRNQAFSVLLGYSFGFH